MAATVSGAGGASESAAGGPAGLSKVGQAPVEDGLGGSNAPPASSEPENDALKDHPRRFLSSGGGDIFDVRPEVGKGLGRMQGEGGGPGSSGDDGFEILDPQEEGLPATLPGGARSRAAPLSAEEWEGMLDSGGPMNVVLCSYIL